MFSIYSGYAELGMVSMEYTIRCARCGVAYPDDAKTYRCSKCGSVLEVSYRYPTRLGALEPKRITHRRYVRLFPLRSRIVSLGEGGTKLLKIDEPWLDCELMAKIETENPTHSFKDRGSSVEITKAIEAGFNKVACASTGNMALSVATYASSKGLSSVIFLGRNIQKEKLQMIKDIGAKIVRVNGDFNKAMAQCEQFAFRNDAFLCGDYHYRKEGQKSLGFELLEQLRSVPDYIFVQVGNSTLLAALFKALAEFKRFGKIGRFPKLIAVQASGCSPLVRAFNSHRPIKYMVPRTKADAIEVGYPTFGYEGVTAITLTRGTAISVSDKEIALAEMLLEKRHGISTELAGAAGFAGLIKLNSIAPKAMHNKKAVVIVTGNN